MAGTSKKTKVYSVRLPIAVGAIAERRVLGPACSKGRLNRYDSVGAYLRDLLIYALTRKGKRYEMRKTKYSRRGVAGG